MRHLFIIFAGPFRSSTYRGQPGTSFRKALRTRNGNTARASLAFSDLVYLEEYNWWNILLRSVFSPAAEAGRPHDVAGLQKRRSRQAAARTCPRAPARRGGLELKRRRRASALHFRSPRVPASPLLPSVLAASLCAGRRLTPARGAGESPREGNALPDPPSPNRAGGPV